MFRARQKQREEEEAAECVFVAGKTEEVEKPARPLPVVRVAPGKWWIHGLYEEQVLKDGLTRLDREWEERRLFSRRDVSASATRLLCEGLLADLVAGDRMLSDVHKTDVAMAQGDLVHLTMRQLLRLRVNNLHFAPQGDENAAVHAFLFKLDHLLFGKLGQKAAGDLFPHLNQKTLFRLGVDLTLVSAVAPSLAGPSWWVLWAGQGPEARRFFLEPSTFCATLSFPSARESSCGVFEITDSSKVCHHSRGRHRILDWKISAHTDQRTLRGHLAVADRNGNAVALGAGGLAIGPKVEELILDQALRNMKKIGSCLW